jgi:hypothetical protein
MQAGTLFMHLASLLGPGFASLGVALSNEGSSAQTATDVSNAVRELFAKVDRREFESIVIELLEGSRANVEGEFVDLDKSGIDSLFRGRVASLYYLVWLALRENFASFFEDLGLAFKGDFQKRLLATISKRIGEAMGETKKNEQTERKPNDSASSGRPNG